MRVRLKGVNTVRRRRKDGSVAVYRYHRATGHPLEGEPGSPEFLASMHEAEKLQLSRHDGTVIGLIRRFTLSDAFACKAEATQREYRRILTKVVAPKNFRGWARRMSVSARAMSRHLEEWAACPAGWTPRSS